MNHVDKVIGDTSKDKVSPLVNELSGERDAVNSAFDGVDHEIDSVDDKQAEEAHTVALRVFKYINTFCIFHILKLFFHDFRWLVLGFIASYDSEKRLILPR